MARACFLATTLQGFPGGISTTSNPRNIMTVSDLCFLTARELARRIREKEVSCVEVMEAHLAQIERVNPKVNAIVTLVPERAMDGAKAADAALARGDDLGPLHGLPVAHKDLVPTKGIRTTRGSPIFADWVPEEAGLIVERLRAPGALTSGQANTPAFRPRAPPATPAIAAPGLQPAAVVRGISGITGFAVDTMAVAALSQKEAAVVGSDPAITGIAVDTKAIAAFRLALNAVNAAAAIYACISRTIAANT